LCLWLWFLTSLIKLESARSGKVWVKVCGKDCGKDCGKVCGKVCVVRSPSLVLLFCIAFICFLSHRFNFSPLILVVIDPHSCFDTVPPPSCFDTGPLQSHCFDTTEGIRLVELVFYKSGKVSENLLLFILRKYSDLRHLYV
jgi:hypothetical protein